MKFYIHPINPNYSATDADDFALGWCYGIWEHPYPALDAWRYRFQSKTLVAARDTQKQAEEAARHVPDEPVEGDWLRSDASGSHLYDPHSDYAARNVLAQAAREQRPVAWPWTDAPSDAPAR